jgi:hypothetical protein
MGWVPNIFGFKRNGIYNAIKGYIPIEWNVIRNRFLWTGPEIIGKENIAVHIKVLSRQCIFTAHRVGLKPRTQDKHDQPKCSHPVHSEGNEQFCKRDQVRWCSVGPNSAPQTHLYRNTKILFRPQMYVHAERLKVICVYASVSKLSSLWAILCILHIHTVLARFPCNKFRAIKICFLFIKQEVSAIASTGQRLYYIHGCNMWGTDRQYRVIFSKE